jgi:TubC N-terminal docking domain
LTLFSEGYRGRYLEVMLSELRENGFQVTLDGEDIVVSPAYKLTPEQRELIREHKAEIIAELAQQTAHVTPDLTREDRCQEALPESAKARRFKITLTTGQVLLHSRPGGLTRQEATELSKDWGEVAECVPACSGDRVPVQSPSSNAGDHREMLAEAEVVRLACFVFESYGDDAASPEIQADLAEVATLYRKDPVRWSQYWGERARACGDT